MRIPGTLLLYLLLLPSAHAQEYKLLKQFPAELIKSFNTAPGDERGYQGPQKNYDQIHDPEYQRGGAALIIYGALTNDSKAVNDGFRIVDATFREQKSDGSIGDAKGYVETGNILFLMDTLRSFLVLQESPLSSQFKSHLQREKSSVSSLIGWLSRPEQQQNLLQQNDKAPNRCLATAVVFARANKFLGRTPWNSISQKFLDLGMKSYRPSDGVFIEGGGGDSSYQAVNLLMLEYLYTEFGRNEVLSAFDHGLKWEEAKVQPDGSVSSAGNTRTGGKEFYAGRVKTVNYFEVNEMFQIACVAMHHPEACNLAAQILIHRKTDRT